MLGSFTLLFVFLSPPAYPLFPRALLVSIFFLCGPRCLLRFDFFYIYIAVCVACLVCYVALSPFLLRWCLLLFLVVFCAFFVCFFPLVLLTFFCLSALDDVRVLDACKFLFLLNFSQIPFTIVSSVWWFPKVRTLPIKVLAVCVKFPSEASIPL